MAGTLDDLLTGGLTSDRVIAVYSTLLDTLVRRAITLVFAAHPELSVDAFTWLSLGSNGRREAVPSSDVDTAVVFADGLSAGGQIAAYRVRLRRGARRAGPGGAQRRPPWRDRAPPGLLADRRRSGGRPAGSGCRRREKNKGAVMASLLVDGRPIFGDPGLSAVARVFSDLRRHHGTMRLLLQESLSHRARMHSVLDVLVRRDGSFDIKSGAILPVVNLARWAALSVGSVGAADRGAAAGRLGLGHAAGPAGSNLIEAFEVLQRLRLRYQLLQVEPGSSTHRRAHAGVAVADRPEHGDPGGTRGGRGAAPDGQHLPVRADRRLDVTGGDVSVAEPGERASASTIGTVLTGSR